MKELFEDNFFNYDELKLDNFNSFVEKNDIITINFISGDGMINKDIQCLKTEIFAEVEEKLYKIFDKFRELSNVFLHGGDQINRFKTIDGNNIKDGDKIVIQTFE